METKIKIVCAKKRDLTLLLLAIAIFITSLAVLLQSYRIEKMERQIKQLEIKVQMGRSSYGNYK
ncbi:hypothetical protein [Carboxydothermus pertinax]|uniref:Uncharacterized protein n=1 Tax=Carboxydothermus pertinax TaxID=870242 RepID=A0A1L8CS01_9THEO|nr:hypothetical protein [Carboxydothermus pertinax]GAV21589.1 hypothetical protein cpu_00990 [Carboxydothermus pertinax]